jgi:hypothetical protein
MADYIPAKDAEFDPWFKNLCEYVTQRTTMGPLPWTHVPPDEAAKLNNAYATWHTAYEATLKLHSPVETVAKNTARADAEAVMRPFKRRYLDGPPVTNEDLIAMGLPIPDHTRTPDKAPSFRPCS